MKFAALCDQPTFRKNFNKYALDKLQFPSYEKQRSRKEPLFLSAGKPYSSLTRTMQVALTPEAGFFTVMVTRPSLRASR